MRRAGGFTLVELMIVVAIIAILAAIAVPAYQDFAIRAKLSEAYSMAMGARNDVGAAWNANGIDGVVQVADDFPANNPATHSKYIDYITVANDGVITIVIRANAGNGIPAVLNGNTFTLTPQINAIGGYQALAAGLNGNLDWACASDTNLTASTRGMLSTAGTLPSRYLPSECR